MSGPSTNYITHTILHRSAIRRPDLCVFCDCVGNELYENPCVTLQPKASSGYKWSPQSILKWEVKLNKKGGFLTVRQCPTCSALVVEAFMSWHKTWHEKLAS